MNTSGISAFHHDSVAGLVRDGEIIAAVANPRGTTGGPKMIRSRAGR